MSTHLIHLYLVEYAFFSLKKSKIVSGLTFRKEKKIQRFLMKLFLYNPHWQEEQAESGSGGHSKTKGKGYM